MVVCTLNGCGLSPNDKNYVSTSDVSKYDKIDYNKYLKKIWVIEDESIHDNYGMQSFLITKIDNSKIEGKIAFGTLALPTCFYFSLEDFDPTVSFKGIISNGTAKCTFNESDNGNKGTLELIFNNCSEMNAIIQFENYEYPQSSNLPDGKYRFVPYNFSSIEHLTDVKSFSANLNDWGNINITTGYIDIQHPYAVAYITDASENIFYRFDGITNGIKIKNVFVEDVNSDDLQDVRIALDTQENEKIEYIYIQNADGVFYDSKLDSDPDISKLSPLP